MVEFQQSCRYLTPELLRLNPETQWTPDELCYLATSESWQTDEYSDEGYLALKYLFYRLMIPKDKWEAVDFNKFLSIVKLKYQERLNEDAE